MFQRVYQIHHFETFQITRRFQADYKIARIKPLQIPQENSLDITLETQQDALKDVVAPLWKIPYDEQLDLKNNYVSYVISEYFSILRQRLGNRKDKVKMSPPSRPSIHKTFPSPILHQYRHKDVYMVRPGIDGDPKTVGHIVGRSSKGKYVCVPPVNILSPTCHIQIAKSFQDYIRSSSLPACTNFSDGGNWTQIQVRSNTKGETMALVKIHPQGLTQAQIEEECDKLKEYFESGPGSVCNLSSLYFQSSPYSNASGKLAPYRLLSGNKYIMETLSGRDFAVSPGSFFQCNRKMAEILYDRIFSAANLSSSTSILDLGCGIGTISILATPFVRGTVGIDMSEEAIQDAKFNATLNNIHSANFIDGSIEKRLKTALKWLEPSSDIVAVLNPGRCGVEVSVLKCLRETPQIGKVIYVACQPDHEWVIRNVMSLITPESPRYKSTPFRFQSVTPLDMFPLTTHCELVMKFER